MPVPVQPLDHAGAWVSQLTSPWPGEKGELQLSGGLGFTANLPSSGGIFAGGLLAVGPSAAKYGRRASRRALLEPAGARPQRAPVKPWFQHSLLQDPSTAGFNVLTCQKLTECKAEAKGRPAPIGKDSRGCTELLRPQRSGYLGGLPRTGYFGLTRQLALSWHFSEPFAPRVLQE